MKDLLPSRPVEVLASDRRPAVEDGEQPQELDLDQVKISPSVALRFPAALATRLRLLPFAEFGGEVMVAAADPDSLGVVSAVERCFGPKVRLHRAEAAALGRAIARIYSTTAAAGAASMRGAASVDRGASMDIGAVEDNADAVRLGDRIMAAAVMLGASDVHIDSFETEVRVRLRVDGQIEQLALLKLENGAALISRIKVLAGLNIAERRAPQDGRLTHAAGEVRFDVRVASIPTKHGERLTLRLLAYGGERWTLNALGMSEAQLATFSEAIQKPHGLVLLTGPTGSGKSTTLYAAIGRITQGAALNVVTIEDPVEYLMPGVTQVEVDHADKVTFARALRSTLRHDPDVVMIGEIRDGETADIAVKAALTGHLVCSTLHTNDAPGAITRLRDLGVPSYLIAATLRLAVAQRLVRRLCRRCARAAPCPGSAAAAIGRPDLAGKPVREPVGCVYCAGRGYTGRTALFESLPGSPGLADLIQEGAGPDRIARFAVQSGFRTLADDAADRLLDGSTSLSEVLRNIM